jgi:hypothetical protein
MSSSCQAAGLSLSLLKFSGGSVDILRDVLHCHCDAELLIASAKAGQELRHILVAFQSAEGLHRFENGGGGPSQRHLASAPPFDVPLYMPRAADQAFDRIGRRERLPEAIRQAEREDGEGFVEAFTHARGGTGILVLEASREILQETTSGDASTCL